MTVPEVLAEWAEKPLDWGSDCCRFAAAVIEAGTGTDPMAALSYASEAEARAIIERHGSLERAITAVLGPPGGEPRDFAACIIRSPLARPAWFDGQIAGVFLGGRILIKTPNSIIDRDPRRALVVWTSTCPVL